MLMLLRVRFSRGRWRMAYAPLRPRAGASSAFASTEIYLPKVLKSATGVQATVREDI
jgi:hypothetical protein